jgi:hypothetical protein
MSTIKVDKIEKRSGSTLTLGGPSTAVTLACGATQTGFGRTGTVDWCTTAKTSPFTSVSGNGYFVNTTGGVVTVTLPSSPSAGDIVSINDYARTFGNNNVTICRNSSKMCGNCFNSTLKTNGQSITMIYVDGTKGWKAVNDDDVGALGAEFIAATGGTITTCGNFKMHTFTSNGCFQVTNAGNSGGSNTVSYLVVAGGGGGAGRYGGGGGGGGFREGKCTSDPYTASPLNAPDGLPVSVQTYPITVGAGGTNAPSAPSNAEGTPGGVSTFSTITSAGGARGGGQSGTGCRNGGSGGGGSYGTSGIGAAGTGNTPPVSPPQGNPGGTGSAAPLNAMGGGGGATEAGQAGSGPPNKSGRGGAGGTTNIPGSPISKSGGGGGASSTPESITAGAASPCGSGTAGASGPGSPASNAAANSGGGGGGGNYYSPPDATTSGQGGSGIIVIRYKFQ